MTPQERLIATAKSQVGYTGKKTNAQLDSPTANTPGLYNKFARDLDALGDFYNGRKNGYDWCDIFADWCFIRTFGRELGQKLIGQPDRSCGAGVGWSMGYYRAKGRIFTVPQPGDQIFFGNASAMTHTGIVVGVSGGYVHTVEGNAGYPSAVRACKYPLSYAKIKGYGRPDWSLVQDKKEEETVTYEQWKTYMEQYRKELAAQPAPDWAEQTGEWDKACKAGIIADKSRPQDLVTRAEAAAMAVRAGK